MDLDREGLAVICYTRVGIVRGRVALLDLPEVPDAVQIDHGGPRMLHLKEASLMDAENRVLHRAGSMAVNRDAIILAYEDDVAGEIDRLKSMISHDNHENAVLEVERLLRAHSRDADLLYLAGLVFEGSGDEVRAKDYFLKALEMIRDSKFRAIVEHHLSR